MAQAVVEAVHGLMTDTKSIKTPEGDNALGGFDFENAARMAVSIMLQIDWVMQEAIKHDSEGLRWDGDFNDIVHQTSNAVRSFLREMAKE